MWGFCGVGVLRCVCVVVLMSCSVWESFGNWASCGVWVRYRVQGNFDVGDLGNVGVGE